MRCVLLLKKFLLIPGLVVFVCATFAQSATTPAPPLAVVNGRLVYSADSLGNRIPDFSYCGYAAGEKSIPDAPVRLVVPVEKGDATLRIQQALDEVAALKPDANGIRGAVLLQKGTYEVYGTIRIKASGVILRGSGYDANGTVLLGAGDSRETLVRFAGGGNKKLQTPVAITDQYVPVNATQLRVASNQFKAGDKVIIHRPSTAAWIKTLGTDHFGGGITALGWKPGQRDIYWDRTIVAVNNNTIELDAPITTAIDQQYGGGTVTAYDWRDRIENIGIENMRLASAYDTGNVKDEDHRWMAITVENAADAWVRQLQFEHFAGSAVFVQESAKRVTVEDCKSLAPISEIGGERRNTFYTTGQQTLFQRCYSEYGIHDFAAGFCAAGPNAFVQCESYQSYSFSGAIDSWASGILFDDVRIDGRPISLYNRGQDGNGAGWCAANSVLWNCAASRIDCYRPPTAQNWSFGSWAQFAGDGYWAESNNHVDPRSLYYAQLAARSGKAWRPGFAQLLLVETDATSSPTVEQARELTAIAKTPAPTLSQFIDDAKNRRPISIDARGVKIFNAENPVRPAATRTVEFVNNGWLTNNRKVLTGDRIGVTWWSGSARPYALKNARPHLTRLVPGRTGEGLTDDIGDVADSMLYQGIAMIEHNYGLWYDRRRDDHQRVRREDGDVWAPFYELPFARSGQGTAWDGLSKYDLTKYNKWYWKRLGDFAGRAQQRGLKLLHQHYFQHNILEAGAHYADFPWRTANNINNTGFPEPPPYAGDKRIFLAEQFYDTTNAARRALHQQYIRQCLDNFNHKQNAVIHSIGEEFTGPLHFVQFWLNTVSQWEREKNANALISLSVTKDVQDAVLNNQRFARLIDIIDIRYWHYQADGSLYAPEGGKNLAPRQHARLLKPKSSSFEQVYRAVREYKQKFPGKAVIYSANNHEKYAWAVFMAGGSMAAIPQMPDDFLKDAAKSKPIGQFKLQGENCFIAYCTEPTVAASLGQEEYIMRWFDAQTGKPLRAEVLIPNGQDLTIANNFSKPAILWITRATKSPAKKLAVSTDGRFFITTDGQPFFWLGDTGWLLLSKLDKKEAIKYLDDRKQKGFNVIQAMLLHTLHVKNAYGNFALIDNNVALPGIENAADYWDHVDFIIDAAAERGIYMALVPVWGSNVKAGQVSVEDAKKYARFLANRYICKPNIIWLNGGDIRGNDSMNVWKAIGKTLHEYDNNHLIGFHPRGRTTSSLWFHDEPWLHFNMFQSGHRTYAQDTSVIDLKFGEDNWKYVEMDYKRSPVKPTLDGEPSYEKIPHGLHDTKLPLWNDADLRRYAYWSVFAGGSGFTYGHNAVMQMHRKGDADANYGVKDNWYESLNDPGAQQMIHLKNLILSKPYFDRVPDQSLIAGANGERYDRLIATRGKDYAFIYTYTGRNIPVNMGKIQGEKVKASWYDPRNGKLITIGSYDNKGMRTFDPPGSPKNGNDWVLVLESPQQVYLFSSFHEPATAGLRLLYSYDGYSWQDLDTVLIKPAVGSKVMRDPSIVQGPDGTFHLVWTSGWNTDKGFGYASSKDLVHWSEQRFIEVMAHEPTTVNVWAPELFYDDVSKQFIIIWASTIPNRFEKGQEEERNNHRMYYAVTKDFKTFSPTKLFLDPGFSVIDCVIVKRAVNDYVLILKDNTRPNRNIKLAFGKTPLGPYENISEPFTDNFTEGPTVMKKGNDWLIFYDAYRNKKYDAVRTSDFKTFENINSEVKIPEGHKHGTIFTAGKEILDNLVKTLSKK